MTTAPLAGVRVVDLSTFVAGPSSTMTLAALGAEVVRVDPIGGAPDSRRLPHAPDGSSLYWEALNRGKRSVTVDTTTAEGRDLVGRMLAAGGPDGGIAVTNAVGRGWPSLSGLAAHRPDVILVRVLGRADGRAAVDYTVNCEVGWPALTGPDALTGPVNHVLPAWDFLCGLHVAVAVLSALRVRERTGRGQEVTVALADVAAATTAHLGLIADEAVNGSTRPRDGNYLYGSFGRDFASADGQRIMVTALTPRQWRALVEATGIGPALPALEKAHGVDADDDAGRWRIRRELAALVEPWFAARTLDEAAARLEAAHVPWGRYRTVSELVHEEDSVLAGSAVFASVDGVPAPGSVARFDPTVSPTPAPRAGPRLGRDTEAVLRDLAGVGDDELEELRRRGVVSGP